MFRKRSWDRIPSSEITPESAYLSRREFVERAGAGAVLAAGAPFFAAACGAPEGEVVEAVGAQEPDRLTPYASVTRYNNFYEFGVEKEDPERNARNFTTRPWTVEVTGHVARPATYDLDDLIRPHPVEERVYRLRCVEGWSMVIPWQGFALHDLIARLEPTSRARYVAFETLHDPSRMPGQRSRILDWPYREGLRLDEAMNPLTLIATGLYARPLPNQNGAPLRLVVPWKYGFKSIKSIVKIAFLDRQPSTTWATMAPREYGFYANVNPTVNHPRWSQARERRVGELRRRPTLMFNGYGEEVAHLYAGMDLRRNY